MRILIATFCFYGALCAAVMADDAADSQMEDLEQFAGTWSGVLEAGSQALRLEIKIEIGNGRPDATLISIDQGGARVAFDEVEISGDQLILAASAAGISYRGTLENGTISGRYRQAAFETGLTLERGGFDDSSPSTADPRDRDFTVQSGEVSLAGSLRLPEGEGPHPAVVILSGSGSQDRDGTISGQPVYRAFADTLEARGVASLRLDDRSIGQSDAVPPESPQDLAADAAAALEALRREAVIGCVGLLGHSEGGLIALLTAERTKPDFIVTLAGMHADMTEILTEQGEAILSASGASPQQLAQTQKIQSAVFAAVDQAQGADAVDEIESALLEIGLDAQTAASQAARWGQPYAVELFRVDADAAARDYAGPLLAFFGGNDLQVPPSEFADRLAHQRGDLPTEIRVIEGVDHLFQRSDTGLPKDYGSAGHALAPIAQDALADGVDELVGEACKP